MYKLILSTHLFVGKLCEMGTWNTDSSCSNWRRQNGEVKNGRWSFFILSDGDIIHWLVGATCHVNILPSFLRLTEQINYEKASSC